MIKKPINLFFIGVVALLAFLIVINLTNHSASQQSTLDSTTATLDVPLSVTQTMQILLSATETIQPMSTLTITPLSPTLTPTTFVLPSEFDIKGFHGHVQYYSIGCETSTAVDLAEFMGVTIYQFDFQIALPRSDNPDLGFVGDVNGPWGQIPPYAYGVHAGPIVETLRKFNVAVEGGKGYTLEQIKEKIAQGKPVIVWVIGRMDYSEPVTYTDKLGNTTLVASYEHVVVITGYNDTEGTVKYVSNSRWYYEKYEKFLTSWAVLGNMAVMPE